VFLLDSRQGNVFIVMKTSGGISGSVFYAQKPARRPEEMRARVLFHRVPNYTGHGPKFMKMGMGGALFRICIPWPFHGLERFKFAFGKRSVGARRSAGAFSRCLAENTPRRRRNEGSALPECEVKTPLCSRGNHNFGL
jgi:hypothetical protein